MYGILQVNNLSSENILIFVLSCHEVAWYTHEFVNNAFNGMPFEQNMSQTSSASLQVYPLTPNYMRANYTCTI